MGGVIEIRLKFMGHGGSICVLEVEEDLLAVARFSFEEDLSAFEEVDFLASLCSPRTYSCMSCTYERFGQRQRQRDREKGGSHSVVWAPQWQIGCVFAYGDDHAAQAPRAHLKGANINRARQDRGCMYRESCHEISGLAARRKA